MALFIGGAADGLRAHVEASLNYVDIALNPNPPAFTPDLAVLSGVTFPKVRYKKEVLSCGSADYEVFIPMDWSHSDVAEALILHYRKGNPDARLNYINTAEGEIYDNDDRDPNGRVYQI